MFLEFPNSILVAYFDKSSDTSYFVTMGVISTQLFIAGRSPRLEGVQSDGPAKNETLAVDNMIWPRQRRSFASWLLVTYAASTIAVDCFTDGIWYCAQLESVIGDAVVEPAMIEV